MNMKIGVFFRFGGKNDDWMSSISEAFEGFSDFKKIDDKSR